MKSLISTAAVFLIALVCGCTTTSYSTKSKVVAPVTIKSPKSIPPEIAPYVPMFVEVLESSGFKVGKTTDPSALELRFEFNGNPFNIRVAAGLWREGIPVLTASSTNPGWGTALARGAAVNGRAESAVSAFESEIKKMKNNFVIVTDADE